MSRWIKNFILGPLQGSALIFFYSFLKLLPVEWASTSIGALARWIGPYLKVSQLGRANLKAAFPKKTDSEIEKMLEGVWENLGRVVGEFSHITEISRSKERIELVNLEVLEQARDSGKAGIFFAGHLACWELPHLIVIQHKLPIWLISRPPNNWVTKWFLKIVRTESLVNIIQKGSEGAKESIKVLRQNGHLGILVDQRLSEGTPLPFFGRPALTALGPAKLAHKYEASLIPVQVERLPNVRFRVTFHKPLILDATPEKTMKKVNKILEEWIRQNPDQWLWLHKRWKL